MNPYPFATPPSTHGSTYLKGIDLEMSRLGQGELALLEGHARALGDALVVQALGQEKAERVRRTAHADTMRKAETLDVEILEVSVPAVPVEGNRLMRSRAKAIDAFTRFIFPRCESPSREDSIVRRWLQSNHTTSKYCTPRTKDLSEITVNFDELGTAKCCSKI